MQNVQKLIAELIAREGGYVNHAADKGGPTKYGITQATLSAYLGRKASLDEVKALDQELAAEIYLKNYYHAPRIDTLPDDLQPIMLDMQVIHRPRVGIKILQRVINLAGFGPVDIDGALGPQTRAAAARAADEMGPYLINAIVEERLQFFRLIVRQDKSQIVFLKGWEARAEGFREEVAA